MALFTLNPLKSLISYLKLEVIGALQMLISQRTDIVASTTNLKLHTLLTSGTLTVGYIYEITDNTGADFTGVGAADNVVGTQFRCTSALTPTWGTGELAESKSTLDGATITVSGTSTIQTISRKFLNIGTKLHLIASGTWTLEHEAGSTNDAIEISLKGGANLTVASGDEIILQYRSDGKWHESYSKIAVVGDGLLGMNIETSITSRTLTPQIDKIVQVLSGNASIITLSQITVDGDVFVIQNVGTGAFTIVDESSAATIATVGAKGFGTFYSDGTNWRRVGYSILANSSVIIGDGAHGGGNYNTVIGDGAYTSKHRAIVIGQNTTQSGSTSTYSIVIGNDSVGGSLYSVVFGTNTTGGQQCSTIGAQSTANSKYYSHSLGYALTNQRDGETLFGGGSRRSPAKALISSQGYSLCDTYKEIYCNSYLDVSRINILASTTAAFFIRVVILGKYSLASKYIEVKGLIGRDASNNTALVGAVTKTIIAESGVVGSFDTNNWDVQITADDTNEAVKVELKSDAAIIAGDSGVQLSNLYLEDSNLWSAPYATQYLYWTLTDTAGTRTFNLYSDVGHTSLKASGTIVGDGTLTIVEITANYCIKGTVDIAYSSDDTDAANIITIERTKCNVLTELVEIEN